MAMTMTALTPNPRVYSPGMSEREYSCTFSSSHGLNGCTCTFGSTTNFKSKVYSMIVTKSARTTNTNFELDFNPGTGATASAAKVKLRLLKQSTTNSLKIVSAMVTTSSDRHTVKFRAIFRGY